MVYDLEEPFEIEIQVEKVDDIEEESSVIMLVEERSLLKHRVSTLGKNLLELSVRYSKTELV